MALVTSTSTIPGTLAPRTPITSPSPGTWRHPKFDEIARRQQATTFNDRNVTTLLWNSGALVMTWPLGSVIGSYSSIQTILLGPLSQALGNWPLWTTQNIWNYLLPLLFIYNIFSAISPLLIRNDNLADIPLTPSQRSLLGLDPSATPPATPDTQYITPPRYPRSATPRSGTPGSRSSSAAGSPLSRKESPMGRQASDSSFSPSASPLWQKAVGSSRDTRRYSFGLSSPLGLGASGRDGSVFSVPSTPSPTGRATGVTLNSRWLYERGRSSSGGKGMYLG